MTAEEIKWTEKELAQLRQDLDPQPISIETKGNQAICRIPFISGGICFGDFSLIFTKKEPK